MSNELRNSATGLVEPKPLEVERQKQVSSERDHQLRRLAMTGSIMTVAGYGLCQVFRLGQNIFVSYFIDKEIFGLFTLLNICLQALFMFSDLGVGPSIVQHKDGDEERFLNTAWSIQIIRSLILWAMTFILAYPFAKFYGVQYGFGQLLWLLPLTGTAAMLDGLTSTAVFTAQRRMLVGRLVLLDVAAQFLGSLVACIWAMYSANVLALLSASFVAMGTRMVLSHFLIPGGNRNRLCWDRNAFDEVFSFGKWILLSTMIAFLALQVDRLVLGKIAPAGDMGLYGIAFAIAMLPVVSMQKICGHVLHPLLAEYQRDGGDQMRHQFHSVRGTLLAVALFLVIGVYACSEMFFNVVYPSQYAGAGKIAKMLAVTAWVNAVVATVVRVIFVLGDSQVLAVSSTVKFISSAVFSIIGYYQFGGMSGFIGGLVAGNVLGYMVLLFAIRKENISCLTQDIKYSLLFLGLALIVDRGYHLVDRLLLMMPSLTTVHLDWISEETTIGQVSIAIAVCLCMAAWTFRKGRQLAANRNPSFS